MIDSHITVIGHRKFRRACEQARKARESKSARLSPADVARFDTGHQRRGRRRSADFQARQLCLNLPLPTDLGWRL